MPTGCRPTVATLYKFLGQCYMHGHQTVTRMLLGLKPTDYTQNKMKSTVENGAMLMYLKAIGHLHPKRHIIVDSFLLD